jgi:hypothetical protein
MDFDITAYEWLHVPEPQLLTSSAEFNSYLGSPQCLELAYVLPASKNLLLKELIGQAVSCFDVVLVVDLNSELKLDSHDRLLVFTCRSVQDMLKACCCIASFVHRMKARAVVVLDSFNCYLPFASLSRSATKKSLAGRFEHKLIDLLELILQKAKVILTRKVYFAKDHARLVTSYGSFVYSEAVSRPPSSLKSDNWLLVQPLITEAGLVHAVCRLVDSCNVDFCIFHETFAPVYLATVPLVKTEV